MQKKLKTIGESSPKKELQMKTWKGDFVASFKCVKDAAGKLNKSVNSVYSYLKTGERINAFYVLEWMEV